MVGWSLFSGDPSEWDKNIERFEGATLYQTYSWGNHKASTGWEVYRLIYNENGKPACMIQALVRQMHLGIGIVWVPGGILGNLKKFDGSSIKKLLKLSVMIVRSSFNYESTIEFSKLKELGWRKAIHCLNSGLSMTIRP